MFNKPYFHWSSTVFWEVKEPMKSSSGQLKRGYCIESFRED